MRDVHDGTRMECIFLVFLHSHTRTSLFSFFYIYLFPNNFIPLYHNIEGEHKKAHKIHIIAIYIFLLTHNFYSIKCLITIFFSSLFRFSPLHETDIKCKYLQYAIKLANKRNEKRLSAITELTTIMLEDKLPKIDIDTGQIKEENDGRDREREWNYKNNNHHTTNVSNIYHSLYYSYLMRLFCSH